MTGYTCSDLFDQGFTEGSEKSICWRLQSLQRQGSAGVFVGVPLEVDGKFLQCGGSPESWKDPGTYDKDISSELWGIL